MYDANAAAGALLGPGLGIGQSWHRALCGLESPTLGRVVQDRRGRHQELRLAANPYWLRINATLQGWALQLTPCLERPLADDPAAPLIGQSMDLISMADDRGCLDSANLAACTVLEYEAELRQTIARLRRSEQHYGSLFEHNPHAVFSMDRGGRFTSANAMASTLSGYTREELLRFTFPQLLCPDDFQLASELFAKVLDGTPQTGEVRCMRPDGSSFEVAVSALPIVVDGEVVGLHGLARDITEERRTLQRLRLLEAGVARLNDIVMITDADTGNESGPRIRYVNPAFERLTGYTAAEVIGRSPRLLQGPDTAREQLDRIRTHLIRCSPVSAEVLNYRKDGCAYWVELDIVPVADESGCVGHFVSVQRDITARKRQEFQDRELARKQRAIDDATLHILHAVDPDSTLQKITEAARDVIGARLAFTNVVLDGDRQRPRTMVAGSHGRASRRDLNVDDVAIDMFAWAARQNRPLRLSQEELQNHPHWQGWFTQDVDRQRVRGWLAAPLVDSEEHNIGLIQLTDKYDGEFSEQDEAMLVQLARLASVAIEKSRLLDSVARAEAQYRSIFNNALEGIIQVADDGALLVANPGFAYLLGYAGIPQLMAKVGSIEEIFEDSREWFRLRARLLRERAIGDYVARMRRLDGRGMWALLSLRSFQRDGYVVVEGMVQDVTDRHESEARIRALNAQLEERVAERTRELAQSELLQRTLMDVAPQIVWLSAADGAVRYFNRRWYEDTGRAPDDSLQWQWLEAIHPEDAAPLQAAWRDGIRSKCRFETKCRIRQHEGRYRHYLYVAHPVLDSEGNPEHWVGINADITDLRRAEEALAQSNRELEAFSYSVSHDLRAPLHGIAGFSGALLRYYRDRLDKEGVHYLERISANCARMATQIEEILDLSRVSSVDLQFQRVDLSEIAAAELASLRSQFPERAVQLVVQAGLAARGDPALLRVVLANLLGNAWKFTAGRTSARIEFSGSSLPGEWLFCVRDNGVGFDMAYAHKLFGVFQRLHHESEFPGTGVGLATVRRGIERHRGRIWAESEPGAGASFYFTLPF